MNKHTLYRALRGLGALLCLCAACALAGCAAARPAYAPVGEDAATALTLQAPTPAPTPRPTPTPTPMPTPTPAPTPVYATVAAVGDIMMMQSQVRGAWSQALGAYDFTPSFAAMQAVFRSADLLCANLEVPLAGEENGGYSGPAPEQPTPAPDGSVPEKERQTFNAPDALAASLKAAGFHAITTANNHALDRGAEGALRTVSVLREAGLLQTGTFLSQEDRETPCIAEVNGIRVGLVAWTFSVNGYEGRMTREQRDWLVGRTGEREAMAADIARCRAAGAEFILAFPHWDTEFANAPASSTRKLAQWLLEQGADAVLGSHPHVVQPIEYVTVEREDGPYTGLVAYSLGNFISNMAPSPKDYGAYVSLTLERGADGAVRLHDAGYLPTLCVKERVEGRTLHRVLPASRADAEGDLGRAYAHVTRVCGEAIRVLALPEGAEGFAAA